MSLLHPVLVPLASLLMLQAPSPSQSVHALTGSISNRETGKPIPNVYVYVVKGEEEALTDSKGAFRLLSWKALPLTLHVRTAAGADLQLTVTNPEKPIRIRL